MGLGLWLIWSSAFTCRRVGQALYQCLRVGLNMWPALGLSAQQLGGWEPEEPPEAQQGSHGGIVGVGDEKTH